MSDDPPPSHAPVLAYAAPSPRRGRPVFGAIIALLAIVNGLFGGLMLVYGIAGFPYTTFHGERKELGSDVFALIMFMLIGVFCLYLAIRWGRAVRRIISGI